MNRRLLFALGVSVLAVVALVTYAVDATAKPVVTIAELVAGGSRKNVRLGARVIGEISHRTLTGAERAQAGSGVATPGSGDGPLEQVEFSVRDPGPASEASGKDQLRVVYFGVMPPQLKAERDVILEGDFTQAAGSGAAGSQGEAGGTFTAQYLLTQCPSKYEPPKPKAAS